MLEACGPAVKSGASAAGGAWSRRCWWSRGRWDSGARYVRCPLPSGSSGVGSTRSPMCCRPCQSQRIPERRKPYPRSGNAEDRRHAPTAVTAFDATTTRRSSRRVAKITDDIEELIAFYNYPAEHWIAGTAPRARPRHRPGSTCARPTRSSRPLPPSGTARR
jgi:hypothetical protein